MGGAVIMDSATEGAAASTDMSAAAAAHVACAPLGVRWGIYCTLLLSRTRAIGARPRLRKRSEKHSSLNAEALPPGAYEDLSDMPPSGSSKSRSRRA